MTNRQPSSATAYNESRRDRHTDVFLLTAEKPRNANLRFQGPYYLNLLVMTLAS